MQIGNLIEIKDYLFLNMKIGHSHEDNIQKIKQGIFF